MNIEEIKDRVNKTKNAFHKLGIEGQVNINVMLNDIEFLLKEIEELKQEKEYLNCIIESDKDNYINKDKIKAKIKELEKLNDESTGIGYWFAIYYLQLLLEKE